MAESESQYYNFQFEKGDKWSSTGVSTRTTTVYDILYIKDLPEGIKTFILMFADDTKVLKKIESKESCKELQKSLIGFSSGLTSS